MLDANAKPIRRIHLVDGSGYIFRAYHALPPMSRPDGTPTNAVYGFTTMVLKLLRETDTDAVAVIFDKGRASFRNDIYPDYKAHRPEADEDLVPQFALIREATRAFNLPCIEMEGFEADDIIATYARIAAAQGIEVTVVSSDKDLMQLVGNGISMLDPIKGTTIGPEQVVARFGVPPEQVIDVQALMGDSTDNVPGVRGVGDKWAAKVIQIFGSVDILLEKLTDDENVEQFIYNNKNKLMEKIFEEAGEEFRIGSPEECGRILHSKLNLPGGKSKERKGREIMSTDTATLEFLCQKGRAIACNIIEWRTYDRLPTILKTIQNDADGARLSKKLVTLRDDVPLEEPLESLRLQDRDSEILFAFLREQDFKRIIAQLESSPETNSAAGTPREEPPPSPADAGYALVQQEADLAAWIAEATAAGVVALDLETSSTDAIRAELVGISLAIAPGRACYVPVGHTAELELDQPPRQIAADRAIALLRPLLEDRAVLKVGHDIKFDMLAFAARGIRVAPVDDTMVMSFVLSAGAGGHGLADCAETHLGHRTAALADIVGSGKGRTTFDKIALDRARAYAPEDPDIALRLHAVLKRRLLEERLVTVYETIERPLLPVLVDMERAGVLVDRVELARLSKRFADRMAELETEIHGLAGHPFNIGSPKQLGEVLFDEMGIQGGRKGKTGAYSTGADILEGLAAQGHDLPARVLDWRQVSKLKSTYTDTLPEQINPATGRVHTSYAMTIAQTGRLSSMDPNLQNIPIRTEEGRQIRKAFVAAEGCRLVSLDYSQIELRLLAHVADIPSLKQAFRDDIDIHALTASQVFGVPLAQMTPDTRRNAKAINFGIIYGISAFGLARNLGIPQAEAKAYIAAYFERYPGIRDYMDSMKEACRRDGCVRTVFGRRINIPGIKEKNPAHRGFAERQAINAPLQGAAADIIKRAMRRVPAAMADAGLTGRMLLQVHDELLFEVPEAEAEATITAVRQVMEAAADPAVTLTVPLVVEAGVGSSWAEAH